MAEIQTPRFINTTARGRVLYQLASWQSGNYKPLSIRTKGKVTCDFVVTMRKQRAQPSDTNLQPRQQGEVTSEEPHTLAIQVRGQLSSEPEHSGEPEESRPDAKSSSSESDAENSEWSLGFSDEVSDTDDTIAKNLPANAEFDLNAVAEAAKMHPFWSMHAIKQAQTALDSLLSSGNPFEISDYLGGQIRLSIPSATSIKMQDGRHPRIVLHFPTFQQLGDSCWATNETQVLFRIIPGSGKCPIWLRWQTPLEAEAQNQKSLFGLEIDQDHFGMMKKIWKDSEEYTTLMRTLRDNYRQVRNVKNIVCFGMGNPGESTTSYLRHFVPLTIREILFEKGDTPMSNAAPIPSAELPIFAQDSYYCDKSKDLLNKLFGIIVLDRPHGFYNIKSESLVVSIPSSDPVKQIALGVTNGSGPTAMLCSPISGDQLSLHGVSYKPREIDDWNSFQELDPSSPSVWKWKNTTDAIPIFKDSSNEITGEHLSLYIPKGPAKADAQLEGLLTMT